MVHNSLELRISVIFYEKHLDKQSYQTNKVSMYSNSMSTQSKQKLSGVWKDKWSSWLHSKSFPLRALSKYLDTTVVHWIRPCLIQHKVGNINLAGAELQECRLMRSTGWSMNSIIRSGLSLNYSQVIHSKCSCLCHRDILQGCLLWHLSHSVIS